MIPFMDFGLVGEHELKKLRKRSCRSFLTRVRSSYIYIKYIIIWKGIRPPKPWNTMGWGRRKCGCCGKTWGVRQWWHGKIGTEGASLSYPSGSHRIDTCIRGSTPISGHCEKSILVLQTYRDPSSKWLKYATKISEKKIAHVPCFYVRKRDFTFIRVFY